MVRKVKAEQVEAMRKLRGVGMSYPQIGKAFGVSAETARRYINPDVMQRYLENRARRREEKMAARAKKATAETGLRSVTLSEVLKKAEDAAREEKRVHGTIHNATIDDLATLNEMFDVTFTINFK